MCGVLLFTSAQLLNTYSYNTIPLQPYWCGVVVAETLFIAYSCIYTYDDALNNNNDNDNDEIFSSSNAETCGTQ
jgi:hypothetical protein